MHTRELLEYRHISGIEFQYTKVLRLPRECLKIGNFYGTILWKRDQDQADKRLRIN